MYTVHGLVSWSATSSYASLLSNKSICFSENEDLILEGKFSPKDVHKQCAISFSTPVFPDQMLDRDIYVSKSILIYQ